MRWNESLEALETGRTRNKYWKSSEAGDRLEIFSRSALMESDKRCVHSDVLRKYG